MSDRQRIALTTAEQIRRFSVHRDDYPVVIGFDGFVDSIIDVVDQRHDLTRYDAVETIEQFGRKILAAAGQSSNYELVTKREKLGGNGPIMANAVAAAGLPVTYLGALGLPSLHPAFEPLAKHARCISFSNPGYTDALEFSDGKLMFGKHSTLRDLNADQLRRVVGDEALRRIIDPCALLGMVNWTMLTAMDSIWKYLLDEVLPHVSPQVNGRRRWVFIDLADPEKRTRDDLLKALKTCGAFQRYADVICGFNLKESQQVAAALGVEVPRDAEGAIESTAAALREKLAVHTVVIHPRGGAAAAAMNGSQVDSARFAGPMTRTPKLSTGAGDNFNAGFCLGRLAGMNLPHALCAGTATSGYYVRHAASPTLDQLAVFCDQLPGPE